MRQTQAIIHRDGSLELLYRFITNAFNVDPVASKPVDKQRSEFQGPPEVERILQNIDGLIYALANFDSNPDGTHYIGQTLVECDTFLDDYNITDEANDLVRGLIEEIDNENIRLKEELSGFWVPTFSIGKVRKLIRRLREIRKRFLQPI